MKDEERHIGYYSLVQYCPDHRRREVANVGVALFVPSLRFGEAKLAQDHHRAKAVFGASQVNAPLLTMACKSFRSQFGAESAKWSERQAMDLFRRKLGNDLIMTKPQVVLVEQPSSELDSLFLDLVGHDTSARTRKPRTPIPDLSALRRLNIDENVVVSIPGWGDQTFDFGYQNGSYNLIDKGAFPSDAKEAREKAGAFGAKGQLLYQMSDSQPNSKKLIVVANFSDALSQAATDDIATILRGCHTEIVPAKEMPAFVERVRLETHG